LATAFAPGTHIPDQFIADLRTTGRRNLVASSRAIDTYLAEAPLADQLAALRVPIELIFGEHDQRVALPPPSLFAADTAAVVSDAGHTPPWEAPELISELILTAIHA
jgi:pimeloyl-ACP methyl ester carboxylesterase